MSATVATRSRRRSRLRHPLALAVESIACLANLIWTLIPL
jgi:hypothetical protein